MDKSIHDKRTAQKYSEAILKLHATYCNDIQYHISNLGVRLTFGELSLVQGEPPHHHVAIFIPYPIIRPFLDTFAKAMADTETKLAAMRNQQAPGALQN